MYFHIWVNPQLFYIGLFTGKSKKRFPAKMVVFCLDWRKSHHRGIWSNPETTRRFARGLDNNTSVHSNASKACLLFYFHVFQVQILLKINSWSNIYTFFLLVYLWLNIWQFQGENLIWVIKILPPNTQEIVWPVLTQTFPFPQILKTHSVRSFLFMENLKL